MGGGGVDTFFFGAPGEGGDVTRDFVSGVDRIGIDASGFGLGVTGPLYASMYETGGGLPASFAASGPVFYYETGFNGLWFDPTGGVVTITGVETGTVDYSDIILI